MSTSTALQTTDTRTSRNQLQVGDWTDADVQLIADQVCKPRDRPADPAELKLFLHQAHRTGLDPLAGGQIHAVFRWDGQSKRERMTIQTGIDGLRLIAQRTGEFAGTDREWCGPDGTWREVWLDRQPPAAARATARRIVQGQVVAQRSVALHAEYVGRDSKGNPNRMWREKPALMLGKCAEALALRAMFPAEMSGLYTTDEMSRADQPAHAPAEPAEPADGWPTPQDFQLLRSAYEGAGPGADMDELLDAHDVPPGDTPRARLQQATRAQVHAMTQQLHGSMLAEPAGQ